MQIDLTTLVRRIKQRAYLDSDEEIAQWIKEYCELSNSHKHGVSGKQADLLFLKNFCEDKFDNAGKIINGKQLEGQQKAYAKVLNQIEFLLAGASGVMDKTVSDGFYCIAEAWEEEKCSEQCIACKNASA